MICWIVLNRVLQRTRIEWQIVLRPLIPYIGNPMGVFNINVHKALLNTTRIQLDISLSFFHIPLIWLHFFFSKGSWPRFRDAPQRARARERVRDVLTNVPGETQLEAVCMDSVQHCIMSRPKHDVAARKVALIFLYLIFKLILILILLDINLDSFHIQSYPIELSLIYHTQHCITGEDEGEGSRGGERPNHPPIHPGACHTLQKTTQRWMLYYIWIHLTLYFDMCDGSLVWFLVIHMFRWRVLYAV